MCIRDRISIRSFMIIFVCINETNLTTPIIKKPMIKYTAVRAINALSPVSYTHLDVYKRQNLRIGFKIDPNHFASVHPYAVPACFVGRNRHLFHLRAFKMCIRDRHITALKFMCMTRQEK